MDVNRYKKFALSKINTGNITKNVKSVIKNENEKEQNYREGFKYNRRNLTNLSNLISDVNSNKSKYNFRDDIIDNLEQLNYNLLRLINGGVAPPQNPPANDDFVFPPAPPPIDDDDDDFVFPPPPPPIDDDDDDDDDDDFVFPPPPPPVIDNEGDPFPTLPLSPPPPPPSSSLTNIISSARENLLEQIRNPNLKLKPTPPSKPKKLDILNEIKNPKKLKPPKPLGPPIPIKPLKSQEPQDPNIIDRELILEEIRNPNIKLKPPKPIKPKLQEEDIDIGKTLLNTINKMVTNRRSIINVSSDEDEDEDEIGNNPPANIIL